MYINVFADHPLHTSIFQQHSTTVAASPSRAGLDLANAAKEGFKEHYEESQELRKASPIHKDPTLQSTGPK